ncbi:hypothetical protein M3Y95_00986000 [Aphelenchoides besseyi]|nr:hypothetical protein M3Y95_00986000 [Aphelenchoides besseyi]
MPKRKRVPSPANSSKNEVKQIRIKNEHELDTSPNTSSYRSSTTVKDEKPTLQPKLEDSVDEISTEELSDEETDVEDFSDVHFADHKREDVSDESVDLNFMDEFSKSNLLFAQLVERYGEGWDEFTTYPWLFTFADRLSREMAELVGKFPPKLRASLYYFVSRQTRKEVQDVGQFREQLIKRLYFRLMWKWNDDHFGNVEMMYSDDSAWLANEEPIEETDETTQTREGRIQIQVESVVRQCFFSCRVVVMKVPQTGYQVKLLNNRLVTYYRIFFIFNRLYNSTIPILVGTLHYHDVIFYVSNQGIRERNVWNANVTAVALVCKLLNLTLCDLNILLENDVVMAGHVKMFLTDDPTQTFFPSIPTIRQTFPEQLLRISSIKPDTKMKFVLSVENGSLLTELAPLLEEDDRLRGKFVMLSTRGTPSSTDFWMLSRFRLAYPLAKFLHLGDLNIGGLHIYCFMKFGFTSPNPTPNLCFYKQHFFTFYKTEPFGSNIDLLAIDPELATRADCANVYKNRITKSYSQKRVSTLSGVIDVMQTRDPEFHKKLVAYENRKEGNRYFFLEIQMIPNYARFVHDQLIQRLIS